MAYRDTPFPEDVPLFPRAHHVEDYLRAYATSHDLVSYIRFETTVTRVYEHADSEAGKWVVESFRDGEEVREGFDFVAVTNGHYEKASIPEIRGLEYVPSSLVSILRVTHSVSSRFQGKIMHSRWYRQPEDFIGKVRLPPSLSRAPLRPTP
jgi:cation diffusion facilitator CzcD-associated flavoprotein CzcO